MNHSARSGPAQYSGSGGLRVLCLSSLYPHPGQPAAAAFNRQQLAALSRLCRLCLVAPVPFRQIPGLLRAKPAPAAEPFPVSRPTFWYLPRFKRQWQGPAFLRSAWSNIRSQADALSPQVLLTTWLYPDGWAGMAAARRLGIPFVVKVHGSDLMIFKEDPVRRRLIKEVMTQARAVVLVSNSLARVAQDMGISERKLHVVGNGLDRDLFRVRSKTQARETLGLDPQARIAAFIGNLTPVKGPDLAVEALAEVERTQLIVVGDGPMLQELKAKAVRLGLGHRITWAGRVHHKQVAEYITASDALFLTSRSEGEPNVVLETLGSGRPVAAAAVGGTEDLVQEGRQGALAPPGDVKSLGRALRRVLESQWAPQALAASVQDRGWHSSAEALLKVLENAVDG